MNVLTIGAGDMTMRRKHRRRYYAHKSAGIDGLIALFRVLVVWPIKIMVIGPIQLILWSVVHIVHLLFRSSHKYSSIPFTQLQDIKAVDPIAFEQFISSVFERLDYKVNKTAVTGDGGVDLLLRKGDVVGIVQCKRYDKSVGAPIVRDLYGTMIHNRASEAYLVTTGTITAQAREWCQGKPIHLIDSYNLMDWINKSYITTAKQLPQRQLRATTAPPNPVVRLTNDEFFIEPLRLKLILLLVLIIVVATLLALVF